MYNRNNNESYIRTDNMSVGYNGHAVIKDICLDIKKGEIVSLIGPNGAGKSTILKSIARQLSLISGSIVFNGQDLCKMQAKELSKKMAVMLTERPKTDLMTCYDIVASGRYPYTGKLGILTEDDERFVDEAIAAVHAEKLGSRDFNTISDGQKQRILLARAICQNPEIILLDEPTSFLDIKYKLELLSLLRDMAVSKKITIIMSLHEIDLAEKISDRVICVKGDRIYRFGKPEELFTEDIIRDLYDIDSGFFDPLFGSIELPSPVGDPEVFVISSCGSGIPVYRRLQKEGIPFTAGILSKGDVDYQLARIMASEIITTEPFMPISDEAMRKAAGAISSCRSIILTDFPVNQTNSKIRDIISLAEASGKLKRL